MGYESFTPEERVTKAKINLQKESPFFAYLLMNMEIRADKDGKMQIPTMGVDRRGNLHYNEDFVKGLDLDTLKGVLCHEAMHVATLTFKRQGPRDHQMWNIATDFIINWLITRDGFKLPQGVCMADRNGEVEIKGKKKVYKVNISNMTAEELYDKFEDIAEKEGAQSVFGGAWGQGTGLGSGQFDNHMEGEGENGDGSMSSAEQAAEDHKWKQKAVEAAITAKQRGKGGGLCERQIEGLLNPKIDWRKKLWNFITNDIPVNFSMRRPGRRFYSTGIYTPIVLKENLEVDVAIDVSGSISQNELRDFASEVVGIAKGFQNITMRVIWWSTQVYKEDTLILDRSTKPEQITHHKFNSTGGTHLGCVKQYYLEEGRKPKVLVVLTDGYVEQNPDLVDGVKHLFVISKNGHADCVKDRGEVCSLGDHED